MYPLSSGVYEEVVALYESGDGFTYFDLKIQNQDFLKTKIQSYIDRFSAHNESVINHFSQS